MMTFRIKSHCNIFHFETHLSLANLNTFLLKISKSQIHLKCKTCFFSKMRLLTKDSQYVEMFLLWPTHAKVELLLVSYHHSSFSQLGNSGNSAISVKI